MLKFWLFFRWGLLALFETEPMLLTGGTTLFRGKTAFWVLFGTYWVFLGGFTGKVATGMFTFNYYTFSAFLIS